MPLPGRTIASAVLLSCSRFISSILLFVTFCLNACPDLLRAGLERRDALLDLGDALVEVAGGRAHHHEHAGDIAPVLAHGRFQLVEALPEVITELADTLVQR